MDAQPEKIHLIAIVGRPNVGKSTLFNRLTGKWQAIVEDRPGITRDRLYGTFTLFGHQFRIMDTGGLNFAPKTKIEKKMSAQAEKGIEEADIVLFLMDGREGPTPLDRDWVAKLRKLRKPKIFVVNKIDNTGLEPKMQEFHELGIHPLVPISAEKQRNMSGLTDAILKSLKLEPIVEAAPVEDEHWPDEAPKKSSKQAADSSDDEDFSEGFDEDFAAEEEAEEGEKRESSVMVDRPPNIAIIGRPNVGKSTLLNAILEEERSIVDDSPGTTRDPIHTDFERDGQRYRLIDTAGIRRRAKTTERVEKFSVVGALTVIDEADIVLLVIDGAIGPTEQDAHVAGYAFEKSKAIIVVVNKWDEGSKTFTREQFKEKLELKMNYLNYCPLIFISAKTGKNLSKVFEAIDLVREQYEIRIKTAELNKTFQYIIDHHPLPTFRGRDIKMFYATQIGRRPPSFMVFCTEPEHVHFTYKRYLINALREAFGLLNVPIRLIFRKR